MTSGIEVLQLALNGGALIAGASVWKLYVNQLKERIETKSGMVEAEKERTAFWKDRAEAAEARSPEKIESILEERINRQASEIERLKQDEEHESSKRRDAEQQLLELRSLLAATKGLEQFLEMEADFKPDDDYIEFLRSITDPDASPAAEVRLLGEVSVDSGQLLITDPCYIDSEWMDEPFVDIRRYLHLQTEKILKYRVDFQHYEEKIPDFGQSMNEMLGAGAVIQIPNTPPDSVHPYSYNGACQATTIGEYGDLSFGNGTTGAGVVFASGWGDGFYPVFGEFRAGRIVRVFISLGAAALDQLD